MWRRMRLFMQSAAKPEGERVFAKILEVDEEDG